MLNSKKRRNSAVFLNYELWSGGEFKKLAAVIIIDI